jgi:hypothetical protein
LEAWKRRQSMLDFEWGMTKCTSEIFTDCMLTRYDRLEAYKSNSTRVGAERGANFASHRKRRAVRIKLYSGNSTGYFDLCGFCTGATNLDL